MVIVIQPTLVKVLVNEHLEESYENPFALLYLQSTDCVPGSLLGQNSKNEVGVRPCGGSQSNQQRGSDV